MKVNRIQSREEKFTPVVIEIQIESLDEVLDLWHRSNINHNALCKAVSSCGGKAPLPQYTHTTDPLWKIVDEIWVEQMEQRAKE